MKRALLLSVTTLSAGLVLMLAAAAAPAQARVVIKFPRGTHSTTAKGSIQGYRYIDHILGAKAGQTMELAVTSNNGKAQMVILDPDGENVEMGTGVADYSGTLEKSGNYKIRVLMSRNEARRRGAQTSFTVTFRIE